MDSLDPSSTSLTASDTHSDYHFDQPTVTPHPAWTQALAEASAADAGPAQDVIKAATDPATGTVNTGQLAQQVTDAAAHDPAKANAAYAAVHAQLQASDPPAADRFNQNVVRAFGDAAKGAAPGVYRAGGEVLKSNPILSKQ